MASGPPAYGLSGEGAVPCAEATAWRGLQNLLLVLGTALVAIAAVVFAAVNWTRLDASIQGAFLVAVTLGVAAGAAKSAHRRMPATGEALGLASVLLAMADGHALRIALAPGSFGPSWWAGVTAVVAVAAWVFGEANRIASTRVAAAALVQSPVLLVVMSAGFGPTTTLSIILAQVGLVLLVARRASDALAEARLIGVLVASMQWVVVVAASVIWAASAEGASRRGAALVIACSGAVAVLVAWLWERRDVVRQPALLVASGLGFVAVGAFLGTVMSGVVVVPLLGLVAAVVVGAGVRLELRWGEAPTAVAVAVAAVAAVPVVATVATATDTALALLSRPWMYGTGDRAASLRTEPVVHSGGPLALHLLALVAVIVAGATKVDRRVASWALALVAMAAVTSTPFLVPVSVASMVALLVFSACGAAAFAMRSRCGGGDRRGAVVVACALAGLGLAWSAAAPPLTVVALGTVTLAAAAVALRARSLCDRLAAAGGTAVSVVAGSSLAAVLFAAEGVGPGAAWSTGAVAAATLGLVATLVLDGYREGCVDGARTGQGVNARGSLDRSLRATAELSAWACHGVALVAATALTDRGALSVVLAAGTVAAGLHAARPGRAWLAVVAAGHGLPLLWLRLAEAGVRAPEPYAIAFAAVLAAAGLTVERRAVRRGLPAVASWTTIGPALVVAFLPSVATALDDFGLVRPLVTLAAGGVVLALGALTGRRAAVDVGATVVMVLGLRQVAPVVGSLPGWATIGATGALLLAVGATFEQRRRDVVGVRRHYRALV